MKKITLALLSATFMILCASCRTTYLPPKRPFAGMFPTVMSSVRALKDLHPVDVDVQTLEGYLCELDVWQPLADAGLSSSEMLVIVRGLSQRGYAEIDARRCENCPVRFVLFAGWPDGATLRIMADVNGTRTLRTWPIHSSATPSDQTPPTAE